nr:retrotransposon protein, putative, Ty1-copia subclass [Tanacetum cinerariifolium]
NGQREAVKAIGVFYLCLPGGLEIVLTNCHYAPSITRGVISVSHLYEDGFINRFVNNTIQVSRNNMVYFSAIPRDGIFEIDLSNSYTNDSSMYVEDGKKTLHTSVERAKDLLGLIHTDVCGPFKIMSRQEASYFVTFTDDFSRYGYVYLLKHKHEVFETFKVFQKEVETQLGKTIKSSRSDRGGDYMSQEFLDHLKDHWIIAHRTPPYTPQHNGVLERRNRTLLDMVRSMMSQTTLPKSFWDYALETAARIHNMVQTKKVEKTPYEVWHGQAPQFSYLKFWGCEALIKLDTLTKPDKLEPRSIKCIFIRYPKEMMRYSFYYLPENKVLVAQNVEFLENSLITQEAIELPPDGKTVGSKWLFKNKTDMDGAVHTYKACLVAKGYTQTSGIDYEETFSPVADIKAIRILIAIVAFYDYKIWKMDNKTAFLNGYLSEEVYMEQPKGEAAYILGIKIYRDRSRRLIGLCQSAYIEKILKRYHIENSKRGSIPMQEKLRLSKSQGASTLSEVKRMQNVPYASAVGSIMYAVRCTGPDVAFAQNITSRFQQNPGDLHWTTVKKILKYLRNTKDMFLVYEGNIKRELRVSCYTDSGYLTDADDLKSQIGYVFVLNGGAVDWKSAKQRIFGTSSTEAEYIAAFDASKEAVWVRKFISGLGVVPTIEEPISMYCDNTRANSIANESGITKGARYFRAKVHYLREVIEYGDIKLEKVHTDDNLVYPFTKALAFPKHLEHTKNIGMLPANSLM